MAWEKVLEIFAEQNKIGDIARFSLYPETPIKCLFEILEDRNLFNFIKRQGRHPYGYCVTGQGGLCEWAKCCPLFNSDYLIGR